MIIWSQLGFHTSVFRQNQLKSSASGGISWHAFKIFHMSHALHASHIPPTGDAGCVLSERLRHTDKPAQLCKRTNRSVYILLTNRPELEQHNLLLILLAKSQSERGLELYKDRVKGLDTGRGGELKLVLHSIISYGWDDHASRKASGYHCYPYRTISNTPFLL